MIVITKGISERAKQDQEFATFVDFSLARFERHDWGEMVKEDHELNNESIKMGNGGLFAKYNYGMEKIYIVTDVGQPITTVMFSDEY